MLRYVTALNKKRLEKKIKDPEVITDLASEAFRFPCDNIDFDEVLNSLYVRDEEGSAIASISLKTGDIRCHRSHEEEARNFARMYERDFYPLISERKVIVEIY